MWTFYFHKFGSWTIFAFSHVCNYLMHTFNSKGGFTDILQAALNDRMEIKLVIASGTSWLTDGPSGYVDSMQVIYDWAQAHFFKMGLKGKEAKSYITCVLFPQPLLPFIRLAVEEGKEKLMMKL